MAKNKNYNPDVTEEIEDEIIEQEETAETAALEPAVEAEEEVETAALEPAVEAEEELEPEPTQEPQYKIGVVTNALKLHVRKGPSVNTSSLAVIDALDEVEVYEAGSTSAFYKVRTAAGVNGFCMKKFITLK